MLKVANPLQLQYLQRSRGNHLKQSDLIEINSELDYAGEIPRMLFTLGDSRSQVLDFPEEQLLVAVFPGVPTAAELFLLPNRNQSHSKKDHEEELERVRPGSTPCAPLFSSFHIFDSCEQC